MKAVSLYQTVGEPWSGSRALCLLTEGGRERVPVTVCPLISLIISQAITVTLRVLP